MANPILKKIKKKFLKKRGEGDVGEVLKGGAIAFIYRIATMAVNYGLIIFISKKLGKEGIGIYNICIATSGILIMVGCLGFNTSVVRFVSQYRAKGWYNTVELLYKQIMRYASVVSVVIGIGLVLLSRQLALYYFKDPELELPLRITGIIVPLMVWLTINVEFIRALKWVHISELFRNLSIQTVALAGTIIASFFVLTAEQPLIFYAVGAAISLVFTVGIIVRFFKKEGKGGALSEEEKKTPFSFRSHFLISLPMIVTSFIQLLNGKVDVLMLGYFADTGTVGVFGVAFKLSVITNFVIGALKTIAMPKVSELFWEKKMDDLNDVIQYSNRIIFLFALPISLILMIFPETILGFIDEEFVVGALTLRIFAFTQLINAASGMVAVFLNMTGNQAFFTKIVSVTTAANIGLNLLLIPIIGMEGAAIATFAANTAWNVIGAVYIYKKYNITTFYNPLRKLR